MTSHEKQEIAQIKTDLATLTRRLMMVLGAKPDLRSVLERNGEGADAAYSVVAGGERRAS